ncbi:hypothetical protein BpHYR1_013328 [Brachionus plicatilis]|uniref:Uncharacterized protein n=1 Tax=Brachionus plicatilis TaxID=10195 RepID=A0A3M7QFY0_BRAPC|nr:hypothetical protein BpHYR1_013328 [Brachionus plicatilis]
MHDQELPGACSFLSPKDKSTVPGGFWFSNASISTQNPLEIKELEIENRLAIEAPSIPKCDVFELKKTESLLAIEWKPFQNSLLESNEESKPKKKRLCFKKCFNSLTKSFSMFSISKKSSSHSMLTKSNTVQNIFCINENAFSSNVEKNHLAIVEKISQKRKNEDDESEQIGNKKFLSKEVKFSLEEEDDELLIKSLYDFYINIPTQIIPRNSQNQNMSSCKKKIKKDETIFDILPNSSGSEDLQKSSAQNEKPFSQLKDKTNHNKRKLSIVLGSFFTNDPRLDDRLYYNQIDENIYIDVQLYMESIVEVLLLCVVIQSFTFPSIIIINL